MRATIRTLFTSTAVLLMALPGAVPSGVAAASRVQDGEPTAQACAAFGYGSERREARPLPLAGRQFAPSVGVAAPPPIGLPAVRPPPPPPVGLAAPAPVQEAVVTGSRVGAGDLLARRGGPSDLPGRYSRPPGAVETERYPDARPNSVMRVAEAPVSTFSIDVDTASYSNVRRFLNEGSLPPRDAVRVEELVNYFDYRYPAPASRNEPFRTFVAVTPSPWAAGKEIIHIGVQGYSPARTEKPPVNLTFLVDVSGSMAPEDRLPLARKALNLLIDELRPQDRVSMVVYAGAAGAVLQPTAGTDKLHMRCAVEALSAGGSTAGGQGLSLAYRLAKQNYRSGQVNRVILMTDGDFNVGVSDPSKLEDFVAEQRKTGIYLSVYGFGRGNYQDLRMQTISQAGNGTAAYVDSLREARKLFAYDFTRQVFPIADDVKIQVEFNPARVAEYRLIGYETRLLNREDFNNDSVDAGEVGAGASVTALYEITPPGGPTSVDPLRYGANPSRIPGLAREIANVKIRYKQPGGRTSALIEQTVNDGYRYQDVAAAPEATRWAEAVAAYGQKLRGDPWISDRYGWSDIARLARSAEGNDPLGLRAEFVDLVDKASTRQVQVGRR